MRKADRSIAKVADELGIYDSTLRSWVGKPEIDDGEREGLTSGPMFRTARMPGRREMVAASPRHRYRSEVSV